MTPFTHEEERLLRQEYRKWVECMYHCNGESYPILSFDEWWREMADNAKDRAKYS